MKNNQMIIAAICVLTIAVCNAGTMLSETKVINGTGQVDFLASSGANHLLIPLALAYVLLVLSLISLVKEIRKS